MNFDLKNQIRNVGHFISLFCPIFLQIHLKDIGEIYKIHIGHDNSGQDPGWHLEEIRHELFCLTVDSWIAENENKGDTWEEMPTARTNKAPLPGTSFPYLCDMH